MYIDKLYIKNYKSISETIIEFNEGVNVLVGNNNSGKTTILEALSIVLTGKVRQQPIYKLINANYINQNARIKYIEDITREDITEEDIFELPEIIIEAYIKFEEEDNNDNNDNIIKKRFKDDARGTNNSQREDACGIRFLYSFNKDFSELYKRGISEKKFRDVPIEFYECKFFQFSGSRIISFRSTPLTTNFIDTTQQDYSGTLQRFIKNTITNLLTEEEQGIIRQKYHNTRHDFKESDEFQKLNKRKFISDKISNNMTIGLGTEAYDQWAKELTINVDNIDFSMLGFGSQNMIKIGLSMFEANNVDILLLEEPENNLSYVNMNRLIKQLQTDSVRQLFITTHSSFIANRLNLQNIKLLDHGKVVSFGALPVDTGNYFKKLSNYDTLRTIISSKVMLVEGPTDSLIIERAYLDFKGKLPIEDGIDIIEVRSLAFKRFLDLVNLLKKQVVVVTDNDGDINKNIKEKYKDYACDNIKYVYEKNESLNTIEPSVLDVNMVDESQFKHFVKIIGLECNDLKLDKKRILKYMLDNKTKWALKVFESDERINYPEYIKDAIQLFRNE